MSVNPFLGLPLVSDISDGIVSVDEWAHKASLDSPILIGSPTAPTPTTSDSSTKIATTAYVQSQGFLTSVGSVPTGSQVSTSVVTAATTTFVTALTTTVTLTQTAQITAFATFDLKTTAAASVAQIRVVINGVAGQVIDVSIDNTTDHLTGAAQALSTSLAPGTYTVTGQIARLSGTGTVNFFQGSLISQGLQGTNSNGIIQLTGDVTTASGSGSQAATIAAAAVTGSKIASATITSSNIAAATILNSNISTVDASKITTGTLPTVRGGTNLASWTTGSVPYLSSGTQFAQDNNHLFYDATNKRFFVGTNVGSGTLNVVMPSGGPTSLGLTVYLQTGNHAIQVQNQAAMALEMINASAGGSTTGCLMRGTISRGSLTARTQALNGDQVWRMGGLAYYDATHTGGESNYIRFALTEDYTVTNQGAEMSFGTTPNGSTASVERLKIANSGESIFSNAIQLARYSTSQKNALAPSIGWIIYDTDLNKLSYYNGTSWVNI